MTFCIGSWDPLRIYRLDSSCKAALKLLPDPLSFVLDAYPTACQIAEMTGVGLKGLPSSWLGCQLSISRMGGMEQSCEVPPVYHPEGGWHGGGAVKQSCIL